MYLGSMVKSGISSNLGGVFLFTDVVRLCNDHGRTRRLNVSFTHGWCHNGLAVSWSNGLGI